ncbi:MAX dimerization protein MGA a isoform X2 [Trachinotus anak]|uniref:MAX dimerization protein MGA a isoform X2 n=1 Tax=Trachinotus anak TaxID=443729 RepID=UPI0039F227AD
MASKKKQKSMVFHHEGATTTAAPPAADHPPTCFLVPKPGEASKGGMEQSTSVTNEEADKMGKPNMCPSKEAIRTSCGLPALKRPTSSDPHSNNLPPDSSCKGIRVTLDNNSMWNEFFRCKTEMILTKQGSRMFPYCRFRISGLQPSRKYSLIMDIQPLDNSRYKWTGKSWQVAGKAECHVKSQPFTHPESPSAGQHWMQNPVSFYKLKLTNNVSDHEGNTILHPMHHYLPRLHVVQTDRAAKDIKLNGPGVVTFTFPQTEFMAVTAYQNSQFAQLKVAYNPFAKGLKEDVSSSWGLKLKLNSGKDSLKDGVTTTNEQHPVKKSLKSLLANHKPRGSKAADSKPSVSDDLQKNSTTNIDQSAAKVPGESLCSSSRPAQKLFSELIREAHVSLQRCNLEQMGINNSTSHRTELTNTKTTALRGNRDVRKKDSISVKTHSETSPAKKGETLLTKRKIKDDKQLLNSLDLQDSVGADCPEVSNVAAAPVVSQSSSVDSDHQLKPEAPSEVNVKQHKRPAPLPLPALALFLKQHSTKSKKAKGKLDSPTPALPSESLSGSQSSAAASTCLPSGHASNADGSPKNLTGDFTKSNNQASRHTAEVHPGEMVLNVTGQAVDTALQPSSPLCPDAVATPELKGPITDDRLVPISVAESSSSDPAVLEGPPVLPNSDQSSCTLGTSTSTISSPLATSSSSPMLSPPLDTVLPALNSPQTPTITESSTLLSDCPSIKSHCLLPDPECCSFGFEPLSPACSPEPLPPMPTSLAIELDSTTSEPTPKALPSEGLPQSLDSATSVFKWHTVLPLPQSYIDASFTTFQTTSQTLPLGSISSPLLPSPTPSHPEPQTLDTSTSTPPPGPPPSFQENEQSLPFPAELSPLQLPLSPTFSSLDGDGLSPTPSIADLVHFFSTDDDLGMGVEFSNTEAVAVTCPPPTTVETNAQEPSQQVQPFSANKPFKRKKKSWQRKLGQVKMDQKIDDSTYTSMQPNLEEVEEQLFISFTSKEALKLHIPDSSEGTLTQPQTTPESHMTQPADTPENESQDQRISACEKILLRDLKLMKHKQVIHPVLQEVGLKMNLLDSTLAIDLQYLGVCLPIPPPGVCLEPLTQELPPSQGASAAFVSRTGKTTDVTQIKGWRDKFTPSEAPPTPSSATPEAGPSSDLPKKNLSAFCSDMLDEYLENEGKLIDERAASFAQPLVEPVVYKLPTRSTSYVRTLDSVLKKHSVSSPTSDLISGFIPPSKRPKLSLKEMKTSRKAERKQRGLKQTRLRPEPAAAPVLTPEPGPAEPNLVTKHPAVLTPAVPPPSKQRAPITEPHKSRRNQLKVRFDHTEPLTVSPPNTTFKRRRKLKPKTSSQTLSPPRSLGQMLDISEDLAPLESDSELGTGADQGNETHKDSGPVMTRAILRQKDLEDGVVWEGQPRTSITEERAAIALTSLFTLMGFVSENPTAPIQLIRRRAPPCLNEFCRLGCVCSSLSHCSRISHCGRPHCMFGCSCLKQKVVLLKNLDGSDSSPSQHENAKRRRRRRRRMKMAYILKEADSVSQPAERVRILWKRDRRDSDPDPIHIPEAASVPPSTESRENNSSCARVRGYQGKRRRQKQQEATKDVKPKGDRLKSLKHRDLTLKTAKTRPSSPPPGEPARPPPPHRPPSPPSEPTPKPSKRLIILAECKWASDADRNHVLKKLCEAMAHDRLDGPFWIRKYLISPISQTVEESGGDRCIQYRIHISSPRLELEKPAAPKPQPQGDQRKKKPENHMKQVEREALPPEDRPREAMEEAEPLEDWQREVEEGDIQEEEGSTLQQVDDGRERSGGKMKTEKKKKIQKKMVNMALPFLTGISPAGFLSANRKQPGGTDHLVQVNGKLYPLAKIQLGKMGALHPANRLAAYLTGRVGSNRKPQGSSSSSSSSSGPPRTQSPGLTPPTVFSTAAPTTTPPRPPPAVTLLRLPPSATDSQVSRSVVQPGNPALGLAAPEGSPMLIQVPGPPVKFPVLGLAPRPPPPPSTGQRMVLQLVQTASGVQYYRRPDGKLVQLIPISQLRPINPKPPVQTGGSAPSVAPPPSLQTPTVTVSQTLPQTSVTTSTVIIPSPSPSSSSSPSSPSPTTLSGLKSFSVPPLASPLSPCTGFLSQKGACTFKILPTTSTKEPIIIACPKLPSHPPSKVPKTAGSFTLLHPQPHSPKTPVNLISLKPSMGQGAELGVKTVTVSAVPVDPGGVVVPQEPASPQTPREKTLRAPQPPLPPSGSEVKPVPLPHPPSEPELACALVDLDIICVDDEVDFVSPEMQSTEEVDLVGSSSGETENSSDFEEESSGEEEKKTSNHVRRHIHNVLERRRRVKMLQLFDGLRREVGLSNNKTSKISTLNQAVKIIQDLRTSETDLKRKKRRLMKRRDEYLSTLAPPTGKSEQRVLRKLQYLSSKQKKMEEKERQQAANDLTAATADVASDPPPVGGGASDPPTGESAGDDIITSSNLEQQTPQAPPTTVYTPSMMPVTMGTPVQTQRILQVSKSVLAPSAVSHNARVVRERPRTIPNILSRSKNPAPPLSLLTNTVEGEALSFQALVPTDVLSLVGAALPGQQVLTLSPVMSGPTVPQTSSTPGVASVTLNIPSLTNQQINLTSQPCPPTASNFNKLLQLVQPVTAQQQQQPPTQHQPQQEPQQPPTQQQPQPPTAQQQQPQHQPQQQPPTQQQQPSTQQPQPPTQQPQQQPSTQQPQPQPPTQQPQQQPSTQQPQPQPPTQQPQQQPSTQQPQPPTQQQHQPQQQQQVPAGQPTPPPPLLVSAGSDVSSEQVKDQDQSPSQTDPRPESTSTQAASSSLCPGLSADCRVEVRVGGPLRPEARGGAETEGLTSLLNEIVFLNRQTVSMATTEGVLPETDPAVGGAKEQGHTHSPWVLQPDPDSDDTITMETEELGLQTHVEMRQTTPETELANGNTKGGVLAPPPLLQMKVGGFKVADPVSSDRAAATGGSGRGGRGEGGVAWRPMPRLVPLGLRGNPPS